MERTLPAIAAFSPGDLIFFHRDVKRTDISAETNDFESAVVSVSRFDSNVFHVALVVHPAEERIVHAVCGGGVCESTLLDVVNQEQPDCIELCHVELDSEWKLRASEWALQRVGDAYNDIFSPNCVDSRGRRAYYCCQLAVESYKFTAPESTSEPERSPFLPHRLNFCDRSGRLIPYWVEYYKERCPEHPDPPQGQPGSHPSILRTSPCVQLVASKALTMKRFSIPSDLLDALHFINGSRVSLKTSAASRRFEVVEPRNGELLAESESATEWQVDEVAGAARKAHKRWAATPWMERRQVLKRTADLIRRHANEISLWETRDCGKPIRESKMDILGCADTFDYFSGVDLAGEHLPYDDRAGRFAYTRREPFGVVGAIGTWNYPFQNASWKIAPAIACGNAVLYKPSPLAPVTSILLAQLLQCAGLPDGVVNVLQGDAATGTAICHSTLVNKVSFTGSVDTLRRVAEACAMNSVKPVMLELGGKSAMIVFGDADLETAVNGALAANFYSQGQVCTNASKVLVHRSLLEEFTAKLLQRTEGLRIGDPLNESTHIGACISQQHMLAVQHHIKQAVEEGAQLLYGGEHVIVEALEGGYYLSPCILSNINEEMTIYREEVFGAVLLIIAFDVEEEALAMAKDTEFGLAAGIFTKDINRAHGFATRLNAGQIYINSYNDFSPFVPFGGFKQSGYGRENGKAALDCYTQLKSVYVNASGKLEDPFP